MRSYAWALALTLGLLCSAGAEAKKTVHHPKSHVVKAGKVKAHHAKSQKVKRQKYKAQKVRPYKAKIRKHKG